MKVLVGNSRGKASAVELRVAVLRIAAAVAVVVAADAPEP